MDFWSGRIEIEHHGEVVLSMESGRWDGARSQASSISKQLMAVVVLQLVDRRALRLAATVADVLPDVPVAWRAMSVHQLLTHTSGLGHWQHIAGVDLATVASREELDALVARAPLLFEPGTRWSYSGPGYLLLAAIVEAVCGQTYSAVVEGRVLRPAGMARSSSGRFPVGEPDVAVGRHDGERVELNPVLTAMPGTGDLWTTTGDLLRFARALRVGRLLEPASLDALQTAHTPTGQDSAGPIRTIAYGYGTYVGSIAGRRAVFHPGDNPGYTSILAYLPEHDLTAALLSNDDGPDLGPVIAPLIDRVLSGDRA